MVLVHGLPPDAAEERLEAVAWEAAVQAGASMPTSVRFAFDRASQEFRGFAAVEFPHKDAAKLFKEHAGGKLEFDGTTLTIKYYHPDGAPSRSRERGRQTERDRPAAEEPCRTIVVRGLASTTTEATLLDTFKAFASVKDIRHFPRRGFAFLEFRTVEDASGALKGFERECKSKVEGARCVAHFDKGRQDGRDGAAEAQANAQATSHLEHMARQQIQEENATKALSGVNAEMWAGYLNSVVQTETVQSANTFELDKASGFYLDRDAGLFYDPNTTYFFTLDYSKYFVYDHEEGMLCHVDSDGKKVPGGERRPLPSQRTREQASGAARDRSRGRDATRRDRSRRRERSHSRRRGGARSRSREKRKAAEAEALLLRVATEAAEPKAPPATKLPPAVATTPAVAALLAARDGSHKPIIFPGGDPLARLAPPPEGAPETVQPPAPKKKKKQTESVLGLAPMPRGLARIPGPVIRVAPGPVKVRRSSAAAAASPTDAASVSSRGGAAASEISSAAQSAISTFAGMPMADVPLAASASSSRRASAPKDWICEICMRKFPSEEGLRRHEEHSELHKQNLAQLQEAA